MSELYIVAVVLSVIAIGFNAYSLHLMRKTRRIQAQTRQIMNELETIRLKKCGVS